MTKLTTHVLDIYSGKPGARIKVELYFFNNNKREKKKTLTLNEDGRADKPLLEGEDFLNGKYEFCLLYTSPSPRDQRGSRMPSSA